MNTSSKIFDSFFNEVDHFKRYPAMKPYVGPDYGSNEKKKIMLIGESNYLPEYSKANKNADTWYGGDQSQLNSEEIQWIHCRNLLICDWKSAGHMIYRELELRLSQHLPLSGKRSMNQVVYMNGFQRPAPETGDSIKNFCTSKDYDISGKAIEQVMNIVDPDLVIFVSKLAWDRLRFKISKKQNARKIDFTCHPGTGGRYWHNPKYESGLNKFNKLLFEFTNQ